MTDRNPRKRTRWIGRALPRVAFPLLLLGTANIAAGCFQRAGAPTLPSSQPSSQVGATESWPQVAPREMTAPAEPLHLLPLGNVPPPDSAAPVVEAVTQPLLEAVKQPLLEAVKQPLFEAVTQPLPTWVQAHRATTLWSGPDDKAVVLTELSQWTFLKVAGQTRDGRVLVSYAGDYATHQPGIGWVDMTAVGPSGNPGTWVTNHRTTALWSGVDDKATRFTDAPQWTKLRIVEGAPAHADRMQVEFFGDGRTRQPGIAWVSRADIGPITPPVPLPAPQAITPARRVETYSFKSDTDFINTVGEAARRSQRATGVPASVTVAQAILESDWGRSRLSRQGNNLFGIKALSVAGPAGTVTLPTWEHVNGSDVMVSAPFKAYHNFEESVTDHGGFFVRNKRYSGAMAVASDPRAFARAIQDAGYATDPAYASKLIRLMDRYDLYRFNS